MEKRLKQFNKKKHQSEFAIILGCMLLISSFIWLFLATYITIYLASSLFIGSILIIYGGARVSKLHQIFNQSFIIDLLDDVVSNGTFHFHNGLSRIQIYNSEFIKQADRFTSKAMVSGTINNIPFLSSHVLLEQQSANNQQTNTYQTYFSGRFYIVDFNTPFASSLQCLEDGIPKIKRQYYKVRRLPAQFKDVFTTYAESEKFAEILLTPHLREQFLTLQAPKKRRLRIAFHKSKMYIAMNDFEDSFKIKLFRPINTALIKQLKEDLVIIKTIIDDIKDNTLLFDA